MRVLLKEQNSLRFERVSAATCNSEHAQVRSYG